MLSYHVSDDDHEILIIPLSCPPTFVLLTVSSECSSMTYTVRLTAELNGLESHCRKKKGLRSGAFVRGI